MLNKDLKNVVLGNIQLIEFCQKTGIDMEKLNSCNIERMEEKFFFVLKKENLPQNLSLDMDRDSQPDVVLSMEVSNPNNYLFETTSKTKRVLA